MLKSILLVLDDTPGALAARDGAIAFARGCGATVTAAAFIDPASIADPREPVPMGAGAFKEQRDAQRLAAARTAAARQITEFRELTGGWPGNVHETNVVDALKRLAAAHDVIAIGRDYTPGAETARDDKLAPVIEKIAHDTPRPLVVVPPPSGTATDGPILIAFDGSAPCQRSLQMFVQLGLAALRPVRVASVADTPAEAHEMAAGALAYLALHGIQAGVDTLTGRRPGDAVLEHAAHLGAGLIMIGAFEKPRVRTLLFGSGTLHILRGSHCPVFVHH